MIRLFIAINAACVLANGICLWIEYSPWNLIAGCLNIVVTIFLMTLDRVIKMIEE